jgi:CheY-like chemotaxis protein
MAYKLPFFKNMVAVRDDRVAPTSMPMDILLVEDEVISRHALVVLLRSQGFGTFATASEALRMVNDGAQPVVAVVDLDLPGMNGVDLIGRLARLHPAIPSILITASSYERLSRLLHGANVRYMRKPINFPDLLNLLPPTQLHG